MHEAHAVAHFRRECETLERHASAVRATREQRAVASSCCAHKQRAHAATAGRLGAGGGVRATNRRTSRGPPTTARGTQPTSLPSSITRLEYRAVSVLKEVLIFLSNERVIVPRGGA